MFTNPAQPQDPERDDKYGFDQVPALLRLWSGLLQRVVSQAGSYMATRAEGEPRFHTHSCGIYKYEGGCRIEGVGELVLLSHMCYFAGRQKAGPYATLMTRIVLGWDPMDPTESMLRSAANAVGCPVDGLRSVVLSQHAAERVFGGDPLRSFFEASRGSTRDYERWCRVQHGEAEDAITESFRRRDQGEVWLKALQKACADLERYYNVFCCAPSEKGDEVYWINTSRFYGWHTPAQIEEFLSNPKRLLDSMGKKGERGK